MRTPFPGGLVIAMLLHGRRVSTCMISLWPICSSSFSVRVQAAEHSTMKTPGPCLLAGWCVCVVSCPCAATPTAARSPGSGCRRGNVGYEPRDTETLNSETVKGGPAMPSWDEFDGSRIEDRPPRKTEDQASVMPLPRPRIQACQARALSGRHQRANNGPYSRPVLLCCSPSVGNRCLPLHSSSTEYLSGQHLAFEIRAAERAGRQAGRELAEHRIGNERETDPNGRVPTSAGSAPGGLRFHLQKRNGSEDDDMSVEQQAKRGTRLAVRLQAEISVPCTAAGEKRERRKRNGFKTLTSTTVSPHRNATLFCPSGVSTQEAKAGQGNESCSDSARRGRQRIAQCCSVGEPHCDSPSHCRNAVPPWGAYSWMPGGSDVCM